MNISAIDPAVIAVISGGLTLVLSLLLPIVVRPLLIRLRIMDVPNERSSHERPVLRGLGLAVFIAIAVGGAVATVLTASQASHGISWALLLTVLVGSLLAGLLGLGEDLRGISVKMRSVSLLALGLLVPGALVWLYNDSPVVTDLQESLPLWAGLALIPYALLFISSYINVANFMDGLNGISGFHGVIAGLTFAAAGWFTGLGWLMAMGLIIAAGFAGFLPWNLTGRGAFLGDVGSYLLGGATAITSFAALLAGVPVLATIGPMIIYFGDVGVTLFKRVRAGHKWDEPHKEHVYQRLNQLGLSHVAASSVTATFTLAASVLGLASLFVEPIYWLILLVLGVSLVVVYVRIPRMLGERRGEQSIG